MSEAGSSKLTLESQSFDTYNDTLQGAALNATKSSLALPSDVAFHKSMNPEFAKGIDECSKRSLDLINRLLLLAEGGYEKTGGNVDKKGKGKLKDQNAVVDEYNPLVVDVLDQLFERSDMCLDELLGNKRSVKIAVKAPPTTKPVRSGRLDASILHAANLPKPQLKFKRKVDNRNGSVWSPRLKHKYNAQVPLGYTFNDSQPQNDGSLEPLKPHPYRYEISHISYPRHMFMHQDAKPPSSFDLTPYTWVSTPSQLSTLLSKLRAAQEIAVDLEYHSLRSFTGFVCLMQISTRWEDFIVDTLLLREELEELNEVFTDPNILKVFHGAESDIVWLQQDFNIYVVNMFDTYHASKLLDFPKHSLASLLEMYCDFVPDKRYQLADWRIRPLPAEMLRYARSDTHFLLYIYDNLRNALLDRANDEHTLLKTCLERSSETTLRVPEAEVYDYNTGQGPGGWNSLMNKWGRAFAGSQLAVFKAVHSWRDKAARTEDESTRYVLPNHYVFQIAERVPADLPALLGIFRPVPPLMRVKANELLDVIRDAARESKRSNDTLQAIRTSDIVDVEMMRPNEAVQRTTQDQKASRNVSKPETNLWSQQTSVSPARSTLLSASSATKIVESSLFPSAWFNSPATTPSHRIDKHTQFKAIASRIHETLVIAPSLPQSSDDVHHINDTLNPQPEASTSTTTDIEVRQVSEAPVMLNEVIDTIVTVAKSKQKKRKRTREKPDGDVANDDDEDELKVNSGKKIAKATPAEVVAFDYASAPNFLDTSTDDQSVRKKGKQPKGRKAFDFGSFPAPPRAMNEVKGANKAHTFK